MSEHIQFKTTDEGAVKISTKLNCKTDQMGRVLKATLLEQKTSPYYREKFVEKSLTKNDYFEIYLLVKEVLQGEHFMVEAEMQSISTHSTTRDKIMYAIEEFKRERKIEHLVKDE